MEIAMRIDQMASDGGLRKLAALAFALIAAVPCAFAGETVVS